MDSDNKRAWKVGDRARFFHPRTFGTMEWGTVEKVLTDGRVRVQFDRPDRATARAFTLYTIDPSHYLE